MKRWLALLLLAFTGCVSYPKGMVVTSQALSTQHPRSTTKTHFDPGEVPTLCIYGYEGKHVTLQVADVKSGKTLINEEADVPKRSFKEQREKVDWVNVDGQMVPKRKVENIVNITDLMMPLSLPETSTYEARLIVDGRTTQTVRFDVEWKPVP